MWFVYIIQSLSHPEQRYIGLTNDYIKRLKKHNEGGSSHTSRYRPWGLKIIIGFEDKAKAKTFERYLKTGSGFAFAKRHF